jgi:hypothetical protein
VLFVFVVSIARMVISPVEFERFQGPLGVCSAEMAAKAGVVLQSSSLASTVVNTGRKLPVSSTRLQYGHLVTGALAKLQPDYDKGTYPYFGYPDVNQGTTVRLECMRRWNPIGITPATHVARIEALRSDSKVGYLLVVASHWDSSTSSFGTPILRIVAAPAMMTCDTSHFQHDAQGSIQGSIVSDDIWSPLPPFMASSDSLSPLMAATGGTFRDGTSEASLHNILQSTDPVIFKSAFHLAGSTTVAGAEIWNSWLLPLGCNAPIGLTWDLEGLTVDELLASVQALSNKGVDAFVKVIETHRDELTMWLGVATAAPTKLALQVIPWKAFAPFSPCVLTGAHPETVEDPDLLGPLQDMITLYAWRHLVDRLLSTAIPKVARFFHRYLALMPPAIHPSSYLGFKPDPVMLPNAFYHFPINGGWPFNPNWCATFKNTHFISPQAKLWAPTLVDIQNKQFVAPLMSTFADREAEAHLISTPAMASSLTKAVPASALKIAPVPTALAPVLAPGPAPATALATLAAIATAPAHAPTVAPATAPALATAQAADPAVAPVVDPAQPSVSVAELDPASASVKAAQQDFDQRLADIEATYRAEVERLRSQKTVSFSPATVRRQEVIEIDQHVSPTRNLPFDAFKTVRQYSPAFTATGPKGQHNGSETFRARQALFANEAATQQIRWHESHGWSLESPADRARCAPEYKSLSHLLVHSGTAIQSSASLVPPAAVLLVRAPSSTFSQEVLIPVFTTLPANGALLITQARAFFKMALYHQQIHNFTKVYSDGFFTASSLKKALCVMSWDMEEMFDPVAPSTTTWTVYSFLTCLKSQDGTFDGCLPQNGITIIDAKMLALFVYQFFRVMDMRSAQHAASFDASELARHLREWKALADHPMIFELWGSAPRNLTYWWLHALRSILNPYQTLALANRYQPDNGFLPDQYQLIVSSTCGENGPHLLDVLADVRRDFQKKWAPSQLTSPRSFQHGVQDHHFRQSVLPPAPRSEARQQELAQAKKSGKRPLEKSPQFKAKQHLFDLVGEDLPQRGSAIPGKFTKFAGRNTDVPLFQLPDSDGKLQFLCLSSCCQSPWDVCFAEPCVNKRSRSGNQFAYLHVDLAQAPWRDAPESTYDPLVHFLKLPGVNATIRPSSYLKAKTPSANW